jgi:hypothetical protein
VKLRQKSRNILEKQILHRKTQGKKNFLKRNDFENNKTPFSGSKNFLRKGREIY